MIPPATPSLAPLAWQNTPGEPACCIQAVAVSADGETVMAGTYQAEGQRAASGSGSPFEATVLRAYCYDGDGALRWSDPITAWAGVRCVAVSADGGFAVAAGEYCEAPCQGFVRAYAAESGEVLLDYRTVGAVSAVALSADGTWLVAAAGQVELFCRVQGTDGFTHVASYFAEGGINRLIMSEDGTVILVSDQAGRVGVLHNSGGTLVLMKCWRLPDGGDVRALALATEGQAFVVGGRGGQVWYFEVARFLAGGGPSCHQVVAGGVRDVAMDAGGGCLAVALECGRRGGVAWLDVAGNALQAAHTWSTDFPVGAVKVVEGGAAVGLMMAKADHTEGAFQVWSVPESAEGQPMLAWNHGLVGKGGCCDGPLVLAAGGTNLIGGGGEACVYCFSI